MAEMVVAICGPPGLLENGQQNDLYSFR